MDKKGRNNEEVFKKQINEVKKIYTHHALKLVSSDYSQGLFYKKYTLLKTYGKGYFEVFYSNGLTIHLINVSLLKTIKLKWEYTSSIFELSYLLKGEQLINLDTTHQTLVYESMDSYFVDLKTASGTTTYVKNKPYSECKIYMHPSFIKKYNIPVKNLNIALKTEFNSSEFKPHCSLTQSVLLDMFTNNQKGVFKRLFLEAKVLDLLRLFLTKSDKNPLVTATKSPNYLKKIHQVQAIISSDLSQHHTIKELARISGLNDFILKQEFKKTFNKTIFEYVSHLRMIKAKNLLKHTQKPIYEIAELIGYKNATHFSAAFKRVYNMSPKYYRLNSLSYD